MLQYQLSSYVLHMLPMRYRSLHHPGNHPWPLVYGRALVSPLAAFMLPVMVASLVAVLEELPLSPYVWWASALAFVFASGWTSYHLRGKIAEVQVEDTWACVRSVHDVAVGSGEPWQAVLDVRNYGTWTLATIGLTTYEIDREVWPDYETLTAHLRDARRHHLEAATPSPPA